MTARQRRGDRFDPERAVQAVFDAFVVAVQAQDFATFSALHTDLAAASLDPELFRRNAARAAEQGLRFQLINVVFEGALAVATFEVTRLRGGDRERSTDELTLLREGDRYLIAES
ncbi:MAG: hypothetical protein JXR83_17850 [Deltaproteobacteria bacterium]|nr:hypothetical protein [Deltaproteobacteria bacterium]